MKKLCDDVRKKTLILLISESEIAQQHKEELIDYVQSRSAEKQACFRLGQLDMRASAAGVLRERAEMAKGICRTTMRADADTIERLEVISNAEATTVADMIRSMSNHQLAEAIYDLYLWCGVRIAVKKA